MRMPAPMKQIQIKNFGPIVDATINIKALTIFGGANNTGKSFASRLIYSLLKSLQSDLYCQRVNTLIRSLQYASFMWQIEDFTSIKKSKDKKAVHALNSVLNLSLGLTDELKKIDFNKLDFANIKKLIPETTEGIKSLITDLSNNHSSSELSEIVEQVGLYLEKIRYFDKQIDLPNIRKEFTRYQLEENMERELMGNFQIGSISTLFGHGESVPRVQFTEGNTKIDFTLNRMSKGFKINISSINSVRSYPSTLFLESPIYMKIGTSLSPRDGYLRSPILERRGVRRQVAGVPDYVTFLREELPKEFSGDIAFPEILEWIQECVGGEIELSNTGQLRFNDGKGSYSLQTTATGVANIGVIGLLIKRKLINEGTILFIDEPECNLHTAWQVVMAELLMKLSKGGVQVVIATHSSEIIKYIEIIAKDDPDISEHVALNYFPSNDDWNDDFSSQLDRILEDLTTPYFHLFLKGSI